MILPRLRVSGCSAANLRTIRWPTFSSVTAPHSTSRVMKSEPHEFYKIFSPYIQDQWKLTPRLTVTAGPAISVFALAAEFCRAPFQF